MDSENTFAILENSRVGVFIQKNAYRVLDILLCVLWHVTCDAPFLTVLDPLRPRNCNGQGYDILADVPCLMGFFRNGQYIVKTTSMNIAHVCEKHNAYTERQKKESVETSKEVFLNFLVRLPQLLPVGPTMQETILFARCDVLTRDIPFQFLNNKLAHIFFHDGDRYFLNNLYRQYSETERQRRLFLYFNTCLGGIKSLKIRRILRGPDPDRELENLPRGGLCALTCRNNTTVPDLTTLGKTVYFDRLQP